MAPALEICGLTKRYQSGAGACRATVDVVRDVDLSASRGELMVVVGPPGAGKTTLLLCAAGLLRPDRGHVAWFGRAAGVSAGNTPRPPRHVAYADMVALPHAPFAGTVRDAVSRSLPARPRGRQARCRATEAALGAAGLTAHADRRLGDVPPWAWPRIALARALLRRPVLLLADEPLHAAALHGRIAEQDRDEVDRTARCVVTLAGRGTAVVVAVRDTSDLARLRAVAGEAGVPVRATVLRRGRLGAPLGEAVTDRRAVDRRAVAPASESGGRVRVRCPRDGTRVAEVPPPKSPEGA